MADLPSLSDFLAPQQAAGSSEMSQEERNRLLASIPSTPTPKRNLFAAGLSAGIDELQGMGGAALGALGRATGLENLAQYGEAISNRNAAEAAANGRPDLETAPWREGGAPLLPWLGYQAAKQIPQVGGALLAGALVPQAAVPAAVTRLGMAAPAFLGGARGVAAAATERAIAAGATDTIAAAAGRKAAEETAKEFGKRAVGATVFSAPQGAGSMYQEAMQRGEPTQGDALKALALSPIYGALDAVEVAPLGKILSKGLEGGIARRVATGAVQSAISEPFAEAGQTAMENSFRPDLTMAQKAERIVDAAVTGFAVGGVFGGVAGGLRSSAKADPAKSTDQDLKDQIDNTLNPASSLQEKYANLDTDAVIDRMARVEQRVMGGENTAALERDLRMYRAEVGRRMSELDDATVAQTRAQLIDRIQNGDKSPTTQNSLRIFDAEFGNRIRQQEQPQQQVQPTEVVSPEGGMFSETDLMQPSLRGGEIPSAKLAQKPTPTAEAEANTQARVANLIGTKTVNKDISTWIETTAPATDADLVNAVIDRAENPKAKGADGKPLYRSTPQFTSLVDRVANPIAMQQELNAAQQQLIDTEIAVNNNKAQPQALEAAQQKVSDVQSRIATYESVVQDRASRPSPAPDATQTAPSVEVSPPASQTALPPTTNLTQTGFDFNAPTRETVPAANLKVGDTVVRGRKELPITKIEPTETGNLAITMGAGKGQVTMRVPDSQSVTRAITEVRATPTVEPELKPVVGRERITQATPREAVPASTLNVGDQLIQGQRALPITNISQDAAGRVTITAQQNKGKKITMRMEPEAQVTRVTTSTQTTEQEQNAQAATSSAPSMFTAEQIAAMTPSERAQASAALLEGRVVYEDATHALISVQSNKGNNIYIPYDMASGSHANVGVDVVSSPNVLQALNLTPEVLAKLKTERQKAVVREGKVMQAMPEGPFTNAKENVVATANTDPRYVAYARELLSSVGLGNMRILILDPKEARLNPDKYGLYGSYFSASSVTENPSEYGRAGTFGPGAKDGYISLNPGMPLDVAVEVIAHEVGHLIKWTKFVNAPTDVQNAIIRDFNAWFAKGKNLVATPKDLIKALRNTATGEAQATAVAENASLNLNYWLNFDEWFADQTSKWATTQEKPVTLVDKFFAELGAILRMLRDKYLSLKQTPPNAPVQSMVDFLNSLGPVPVEMWAKAPMAIEAQTSKSTALETTKPMESVASRADNAVNGVQKWASKVDLGTTSKLLNAFKAALGWMSQNHIVEMYDKKNLFNGALTAFDKARDMPNKIKDIFGRIHTGTVSSLEALRRTNKEAYNRIIGLMNTPGIRHDLTWEEQPWLHGEPNAEQLKQLVKTSNADIAWLRQNWTDPKEKTQKAYDVYLDAVNGNEMGNFARLATMFYTFAATSERYNNIMNFGPDPMTRFIETEPAQESAAAAREYWKNALDTQLKAAKAYVGDQKGFDDINRRIKEIDTALESMSKGTYFHLGRFGDFGVSFSIRKKDGALDISALNKLRDAMEAQGLDGFEFLEAPDKTKAFLRFETVEQRDTMVRIVEDLMRKGDIEKGSMSVGKRMEGVGFAGSGSAATELINQIRRTIESQIARLDVSTEEGAKEKARLSAFLSKAEEQLKVAALELSSENAIARVLAKRKEVSGFGSDAFRSLAYRYQVNSDALANMASAPYLAQSLYQISDRVRAVSKPESGAPINLSDLRKMEAIRDELYKRSENSYQPMERSWLNSLRAFSFAYYLSSPASALFQQASIPTLVWPELGKKYGFMKSARAFGKSATQAFKIMNAVVSLDMRRGLTQGPEIILTAQALQRAGVDPATTKFILKLANSSAIDFGSAARELGRVTDGTQNETLNKVLRWAGFMNSYSETFSRVLTALAVRQLVGNDTLALPESKRVIEETLFAYDPTNQARQIGPQGALGKYSPVAFQFNTFGFFTMEKLYREALAAISKNATPQEKAEARRFMAGFATAQTLLAGSLGLPFASVLARAVEALVETFGDDDEPYDAKTAWKNYLNDAFGADMGEVLASGLFRKANVEATSRIGLQDLLPYSRFITDRRNFQDSASDLVKDMAGAPIGFLTTAAGGVSELYKGNYIEAAKALAPGGLRGLVNAYEMTDRGYVDKQGNVLPMSVEAQDILAALLGFKPSEKARYDEGKLAQVTRQGVLSRQAGDLRKKFAVAIESGDNEKARKILADIKQFDKSNPAYEISSSLGSLITQRAKARGMAEATGTTIGTKMADVPGIFAQRFVFSGQ